MPYGVMIKFPFSGAALVFECIDRETIWGLLFEINNISRRIQLLHFFFTQWPHLRT